MDDCHDVSENFEHNNNHDLYDILGISNSIDETPSTTIIETENNVKYYRKYLPIKELEGSNVCCLYSVNSVYTDFYFESSVHISERNVNKLTIELPFDYTVDVNSIESLVYLSDGSIAQEMFSSIGYVLFTYDGSIQKYKIELYNNLSTNSFFEYNRIYSFKVHKKF